MDRRPTFGGLAGSAADDGGGCAADYRLAAVPLAKKLLLGPASARGCEYIVNASARCLHLATPHPLQPPPPSEFTFARYPFFESHIHPPAMSTYALSESHKDVCTPHTASRGHCVLTHDS